MGCETFAREAWAAISSVDWLSWATVLFDLIKGVAWPLSVFLIVWLFKEPLKLQIPRLKSAGKDGVVFAEPEDQPSGRREIGQLNEPDHPLLTVRPVEDSLKANIAELKEEVVVPRLIRALAIAQIERRFEWIFAYVFASQVNFLLSIEGIGLPKAAVERYYKDVVQPLSKERYGDHTADDWLKFLFDQGLVEWRDNQLWRTDFGTDFLKFIAAYKQGVERLP